MLLKRTLLVGMLFILLAGCAPPQMLIKDIDPPRMKPMGLFVCSSTQLLDDKDVGHRNYVITTATEKLSEMLKENYGLKVLNEKVPYEQAFKKYFGAFYIDENLIAKYAKEEGCNSVLIVYYAVTSANFLILPVVPLGVVSVYYEKSLKDNKGMSLHSQCSLYGWLVSANNGKILAKSHRILAPFSSYILDETDKEQLGRDYNHYLKKITEEMFVNLTE